MNKEELIINYKNKTKNLIKFSVLVVIGMFFLMMYVMHLKDNFAAKNISLKSELDRVNNQVSLFSNLDTKVEKAKEILNSTSNTGKLTIEIDENNLKEFIINKSTNYYFTSRPDIVLQPPKTDSNVNNLNYISGNIRVSGVSDVYIFRFLQDLESSLPGLMKMNKLVLSKKTDLNTGILDSITSGTLKELVSAEISFNWYDLSKK